MLVTWDEPKRIANLEKHGFDFDDLSLEFFAQARFRPARSGRLRAIGTIKGRIVCVIVRLMGREGISVISMRPASPKERRLR